MDGSAYVTAGADDDAVVAGSSTVEGSSVGVSSEVAPEPAAVALSDVDVPSTASPEVMAVESWALVGPAVPPHAPRSTSTPITIAMTLAGRARTAAATSLGGEARLTGLGAPTRLFPTTTRPACQMPTSTATADNGLSRLAGTVRA